MKKKHPRREAGIFKTVAAYNAGREPERLAMKFAKMAKSPFVFLRGACHLFYDALPDTPILRNAPLAWCCGDAHFENFGSYKSDNRQVYFDINDFDEAALAPSTWDIVRLLASVHCGTDVLGATRAEALAVGRSCLAAYRDALIEGKPLWVERETSEGMVNALLTELRERDRATFLDKRSVRQGRRRSLKVDRKKALPATDAQKKAVAKFMRGFARTQADPAFFKVLDVARRIAGTGSLGLTRFVILVEGNGSPDENYLLELKQCRPSALLPALSRLGISQPSWPGESQRVAGVQDQMQAVDHAFLHPVMLDGLPCVLKELQPSADRVAIDDWGGKLPRLKEAVSTMGRVLAWDQLRASGRSGAAIADDLVAYAKRPGYMPQVMDAATDMTATTRRQWKQFTVGYRKA
jgi:uncharacterized protein (DUF2252 family)